MSNPITLSGAARPDWPASPQSRWLVPLSRLFTLLVCDITREGAEHVPVGPFVLAANHPSRFDLAAAIPLVPPGIALLSARKYQGTRWEPFFKLSSVIWIEQNTPDLHALRAALRVLEAGVPVGLAPEGRLSERGRLVRGHKGAAFLAARAGVPVLPCAIDGSEKMLRHPRPKVRVRLGKPFHLPPGPARGALLDEHADRIMCAIAALLPPERHGCYAGHPLIAEMARHVL